MGTKSSGRAALVVALLMVAVVIVAPYVVRFSSSGPNVAPAANGGGIPPAAPSASVALPEGDPYPRSSATGYWWGNEPPTRQNYEVLVEPGKSWHMQSQATTSLHDMLPGGDGGADLRLEEYHAPIFTEWVDDAGALHVRNEDGREVVVPRRGRR